MSRKLFGVCLFFITIIFLSLTTSVFALDWQLVDDGDPAPRGKYGMAYDTLKGKTILFGGDVGLLFTPATDTWEYDGSKWEKKIRAHVGNRGTDNRDLQAEQGGIEYLVVVQ